jgi:uncharacterized repeat protein (TIGR02543 family)
MGTLFHGPKPEEPPVIYTITFNANGGEETPDAQTIQAGDSITLPDEIARTGYTFTGWNTRDNGNGSNYAAGFSYKPTGNITLYAQWKATIITGYANITMIYVPGGSFQMGKDLETAATGDITPVHTVTLSGFYMGRTEVTQAQYQAVMGKTIQEQQALAGASTTIDDGRGDNFPVYYVCWYEAIEFCNRLSEREGLSLYYTINKSQEDPHNTHSADTLKWMVMRNTTANGYRLPTEAEWEYAAKGGNPNAVGWVWYTYAGSNIVGDVAWYNSNSGLITREVGKKAPNGLGLYDMSGNVWEWCWDWFGSYSSGAQTDPSGAVSGTDRVNRGGAFPSSTEFVHSAYRRCNEPHMQGGDLGFRLARNE